MDRRRLRFFLALTLFAGWVLGLGTLAWLSERGPNSALGSRPALRASRCPGSTRPID